MPDGEEGGNPYTPGSLQWYLWNEMMKKVNPAELTVQKVITENELRPALASQWTFVHQLQSGAVVVQKAVPVEDVLKVGLKAARSKVLVGK